MRAEHPLSVLSKGNAAKGRYAAKSIVKRDPPALAPAIAEKRK